MAQIVEYGFPTLRNTDIITYIGQVKLDTVAPPTAADLVFNTGGLFYYATSANGDTVICCAKELACLLQLTDSQSITHTAEPFQAILIAGTRELIGTRPPVHR